MDIDFDIYFENRMLLALRICLSFMKAEVLWPVDIGLFNDGNISQLAEVVSACCVRRCLFDKYKQKVK